MYNFFSRVAKPARYLGGEPGSIPPKPDAKVRWLLAFPDIYDIGTSHLGLKILYKVLNLMPRVSCERAFAPWIDYEAELRSRGLPLCSMESRSPLRDFDIVGFSLQHEMLYTNILNMLDLGGIPVLSADRAPTDPLVLAGGPCAVNPEPLADFIDAFVIGDGEEAVQRISEKVEQCKAQRLDRKRTLLELSAIPGVYVPSLYQPNWDSSGSFMGFQEKGLTVPSKVTRQALSMKGLDYPVCQVMSLVESVHDRASIEIRRGCTRGCRFCQAGFITRPVRERDADEIVALSKATLLETGYDVVSLMSLSSGDYSNIGNLLSSLRTVLQPIGGELAVPSLRLDRVQEGFLEGLSSAKQSSLTFAPEAGSERLRKAINKDLTNDEIFDTIQKTFDLGWKTVKMYFMIGLPTETDEDLQAIVDLVGDLRSLLGQKRKSLHISVAPFVPKAHTPFQWCAQSRRDEFQEKAGFLARNIRSRDVKLQYHDLDRCFLEAVFARGDRRLGRVLLEAMKLGVKMDDWTDCFRFDLWQQAFDISGIDPSFYANRERPETEEFPWDVIDTGVKKNYLRAEYEKAFNGETTQDCFVGNCSGCGACSSERRIERSSAIEVSTVPPSEEPVHVDPSQMEHPYWYRIQYAKSDRSRFLSHLDVMRVFTQILNRSRLPLRMTQGYHQRPRLSFGMATPLGLSSCAEYLDLALEHELPAEEVLSRLRKSCGEILEVLDSRYLGRNKVSLVEQTDRFVYRLTFPESISEDSLQKRVEGIAQMPTDGLASGGLEPDKTICRGEAFALEESNNRDLAEANASPLLRADPQEYENQADSLDIRKAIDMIRSLPDERNGRPVIEVSVRVVAGRTPKIRDVAGWIASSWDLSQEEIGIEKTAALGRTVRGDLVSLMDL